jgi:hypothetical protein
MDNEYKATLTISDDKKTLFVTSMSGHSQQAYDTGSILIDFLEMGYPSFSMKYMHLARICSSEMADIGDNQNFAKDMLIEFFKYEDMQKEFKEAAHVCFDRKLDDKYSFIERGNIPQRYSFYTLKVNPGFEKNLNISLKLATSCTPHIDNKEIGKNDWFSKIKNATDEESAKYILTTQPRFVDSYWFNSLADVMYFELMNVVKGNIVIKRCENCNRYFVPVGRNDAMYCNRIAPGSEKTCVEIGAIRKYEKDIENNPIRKAYRMEYKKRYARVLKAKPDTVREMKNRFEEWARVMKVARDEALAGSLPFEKFIEKLKE